MDDVRVAGESIETLREAFLHFEQRRARDGMTEFSFRLEPRLGVPLLRALMRVEAELLLLDAETLGDPDHEERTPPQRGADALVALVLRVGEVRGFDKAA